MGQLSGALSTYDVVAQREELADIIYDVSPTATVFVSNVKRGTCKSVFPEWQVDNLADPDGSNAQIEGFEAEYTQPADTTRIGNRCQISSKTARVTGTIEVVDKAGRKSEMARQIVKRGKELKRDIEKIALSNQAAAIGSDAGARKTGSVLAFLKTNTIFESGNSGADPSYTDVPNAVRVDDGTPVAFSEARLKQALALRWENGDVSNEGLMLMVGSFNKQAASAFAGIAQIRHAVEGTSQATITGAADVYVSDFGDVHIVPSRFQRARDALIIDPEYASIDFLRPIQTEDMAKTGDATQKLVLCEWMLKIHNEKAHAAVYDNTTS